MPPDKNAPTQERWNWLESHMSQEIKTKLYREAYGITGNADDANDVCANSLIHAFEKCWQLRNDDKFYQWMVTIVRREARHYMRRNRHWVLCDVLKESLEGLHASANPEKIVIAKEESERLNEAMDQLKFPEKEIVVGRIENRKSLRVIAEELDINYHTTRSKYTRALHALKDHISEEGGSDEKK